MVKAPWPHCKKCGNRLSILTDTIELLATGKGEAYCNKCFSKYSLSDGKEEWKKKRIRGPSDNKGDI